MGHSDQSKAFVWGKYAAFKRRPKLGPEIEVYDDLATSLYKLHTKKPIGFQNIPRYFRDYWRALAVTADGYSLNNSVKLL